MDTPYPLKLAVITVLFIFFLSLLPPSLSGGSEKWESFEGRRILIGSKPPACVNKCKNCRPCMATLVVPNHQKRSKKVTSNFRSVSTSSSRGEDDDTYYLLSWKCKCGDKLFQP